VSPTYHTRSGDPDERRRRLTPTFVIDHRIMELELVWKILGGLEYLHNLVRSYADRKLS